MKRASTALKKEERRASIIDQARRYLSTKSFDEINLTDVARELNLVKGTLYLYFPTKQDLFASILLDEMEAWWAEVGGRAATESPGPDLAGGLAGRELLLRLIASLHMTIEPGLSPEGLRHMKAWFRDFARRAASDLELRYRGISGRGFTLLMEAWALAVGVAQLAFPPENVRRLLETDESLSLFRIGFEAFFSQSVDALYRGMRDRKGMEHGTDQPG